MKKNIIVGAAILSLGFMAPALGEETLSDEEATEILEIFGFGVPLEGIETLQVEVLKIENFARCSVSGDLKPIDWDVVQQDIEKRVALLSDQIRVRSAQDLRGGLSIEEIAQVRTFFDSDVGQKLHSTVPQIFTGLMEQIMSGLLEIKKDMRAEYGLNEPEKLSIRKICD